MHIHIYNPEHDIALAEWNPHLTPPKAAFLTRERFDYIPCRWASDGDIVVVGDVVAAESMARNEGIATKVRFVTQKQLASLTESDLADAEILPWGWDPSVCQQLKKANPLLAKLLPSADELALIRLMSHRRFAGERILPDLVQIDDRLVGESVCAGSESKVDELVAKWGRVVLKSPWSCSGRGVRYVAESLTDNDRKWVVAVLKRQGAVMVEPFYENLRDFAMEFEARNDGSVHYLGLSVFDTSNGAYLSNVIATEEEKERLLADFISPDLLSLIRKRIILLSQSAFACNYHGPFGIDMMAVEGGLVHPCVEMNLRRTMGYAALFFVNK